VQEVGGDASPVENLNTKVIKVTESHYSAFYFHQALHIKQLQ
jgi:hypothetical protein